MYRMVQALQTELCRHDRSYTIALRSVKLGMKALHHLIPV